MKPIHLVYLSPNTTGGWVTFTYHLAMTLEAIGQDVLLHKLGKTKSEQFQRDFGYGLKYDNLLLDDLLSFAEQDPMIIVAVQKNFQHEAQMLVDAGAKMVVHDPAEPSSRLEGVFNPWVIRRVGKQHIKHATFIRHPYVRFGPRVSVKQAKCISTSRIDFDKNTHILLDAKRLGAKIDIFGFENRLYTKFKLIPEYPEWEQSRVAYPRDADAAFNMLCKYRCMADMSLIKGDGGGTQYTTLEAWDAGTVPIVHTDWIRDNDDMKPEINCLTASTGKTLKRAIDDLRDADYCKAVVHAGYTALEKRHHPAVVGPQILDWLRSK